MTNKLPQGETLVLSVSSTDIVFDEVSFEGVIFRKNQSYRFTKSDCVQVDIGVYKYQLPGTITEEFAPGVWEVEILIKLPSSDRIKRVLAFEVVSTKINK